MLSIVRPIFRRVARLSAAARWLGLLVGLLLVAPPHNALDAQSGGDRVELIMGGLPARGSREYEALVRYAGNVEGQYLPLTNCEVWRVKRPYVAKLRREAA